MESGLEKGKLDQFRYLSHEEASSLHHASHKLKAKHPTSVNQKNYRSYILNPNPSTIC